MYPEWEENARSVIFCWEERFVALLLQLKTKMSKAARGFERAMVGHSSFMLSFIFLYMFIRDVLQFNRTIGHLWIVYGNGVWKTRWKRI